jgi:cytochrome b subunit of formate dehydrogenase
VNPASGGLDPNREGSDDPMGTTWTERQGRDNFVTRPGVGPIADRREAKRGRGIGTTRTWLLLLALGLSSASFSVAQKPTNEDCLTCHGDSSLSTEINGKTVSLYVNPEKFKNSIHGGMFACVDCHTDVKTSPHENVPARLTCATCHTAEQTAYDHSLHAKAREKGDLRAATCVNCHGSPHELLPASDPKSMVNHANIPATCGSCHGQKFVMEPSGNSTQPFLSYQESVHGRAVAAGSEKAAVCTDCHGVHAILSASDSQSSIFKFNVPATCGKCHSAVEQEFMQSIHGQAIARGNWQAPVCTDCHGIHTIKSHLDPNSSISAHNLTRMTCARCHDGMRLTREFGVPGARVATYLESYHGLASEMGSTVVANCASCHGVHNILPSTDPRSTIYPGNLVKTCGQCHPGVTTRFVTAKVHVDAPLSSDMGSIAVRWIRKFYLSLIGLVIGGMLLHNAIIWRYKALVRVRARPQTVIRMSVNQRVQHMLLLVSFFVLVLTGFALKFPESWFAMLLGMGEHLRRISHRVAAVVLIGTSVYHIVYLAISRDGRRSLREILPTGKDISDAWRNMLYYLGLSPSKPEFARYNYAEKAEYWALVWGVIIMATTGLMLWAKVVVGNHLPRWWLDAATAVHYYETVLATLAIVVWHFYQVLFDPDVYPMSWAWWDGKMPLELYREEHALDAGALQTGAVPVGEEAPEPPSAASPEPTTGSGEIDQSPKDPEKP